MEMVSSVLVAQQAMIILMMSLFSRISVCFSACMPQNTRMRLRAPEISNFPGGACRHNPLE